MEQTEDHSLAVLVRKMMRLLVRMCNLVVYRLASGYSALFWIEDMHHVTF